MRLFPRGKETQGKIKGTEGSYEKMWKNIMKCCPLGTAMALTNSRNLWLPVQDQGGKHPSMDWGGVPKLPPLPEDLQACGRRLLLEGETFSLVV